MCVKPRRGVGRDRLFAALIVRGAKRRELPTAGIKTHEVVLASARTVKEATVVIFIVRENPARHFTVRGLLPENSEPSFSYCSRERT